MKAEKLLKAVALAAVGVALAGQQAQAVPSLLLSTDAVVDPNAPGPNTIVITDGGLNDMIGDAGIVGYFGSVGNFIINVTTGLSKPAVGSAERPLMDIVSFDSTSMAGGKLTVMFTDTDFTSTRPLSYFSSIGGTTSGEMTYQTYRDESNTSFGLSSLLADLGPLMGTPYHFSAGKRTVIDSVTDPFSLTMVVTVEHGNSQFGMTSSFDAELRGANPEPVTAALSVMGLAGLLSSVRRRRA